MISTLDPGINTTNCPMILAMNVLPSRRDSAAQMNLYLGLLTALIKAI
jgi:hypothetical protein